MFKINENSNPNYLATICKIGTVTPIENSDHLCKTVVNGFDIVIDNSMKEGDIVMYVPAETAICPEYLSKNNLYEISEYEKNSNADEVGTLLEKAKIAKSEGKLDDYDNYMSQAKPMVGYFNKHGRVRVIKLRGCPSEGYVTPVSSLVRYKDELANVDWESLVGTSFSHIGDDEFCHKYVPPIREGRGGNGQRQYNKRMNKLKNFDRIIEDQFKFHYDTQMLASNMHKFSPDDNVVISKKIHGTSTCLSNILVKRKLTLWDKIKKFFGKTVVEKEYGNVYASRSVIKNRYLNKTAGPGFYGTDVWGACNEVFKDYLDKGMTLYGEIVGYLPGSSTLIQKDHDYGCEVGEWKLMPYRIKITDEIGNENEWELVDVDNWTHRLVENHPELAKNVLYLEIHYNGRFGNLYPDLDESNHWHENVLERMKNDTDKFGMELKEPLCHLWEKEAENAKKLLDAAIERGDSKKNVKKLQSEYEKFEAKRAPVEGIVIRKVADETAEAWKLKTFAHYHREAIQHDAGEVDIEEAESENADV